MIGSSTVASALARGTLIVARQSESARTDARMLLAFAIRREREWIAAHPEVRLAEPSIARYLELCERRASGVPVAYIIGSAPFFRGEFEVNDAVLIPRPETELLVEAVAAELRARSADPDGRRIITALDVGTGSGAIACSLARDFPDLVVDATDTSEAAIAVATRNAQRLGVHRRCRFYVADLLPPNERRYDVVVANLPYIPSADLDALPPEVRAEPRSALDGGRDGLALYRRLIARLPDWTRDGAFAVFEAAPPTIAQLRRLCEEAFEASEVDVHRDYAGLERFVSVRVGAAVPVEGSVSRVQE